MVSRKMVSDAVGAGGIGCPRISFPISLTASSLIPYSLPLSDGYIYMKYWGRGAGLGAYFDVIILSTRGVLGRRWCAGEREHNSSGQGEITRDMTILEETRPDFDGRRTDTIIFSKIDFDVF